MSVVLQLRGSQNYRVYRVIDRVTAEVLGSVRRQHDGEWSAVRAHGPADKLVHSYGHRTRASAVEELTK